MKRLAAFTIISSPCCIAYPPLLDDDATGFFVFTDNPSLVSDFWDIIYFENISEISNDIKAQPSKYIPDFKDYIYIHSDQIIIGKLSEDRSAICSIPIIKDFLPKDMDLTPPPKTVFTPNPTYTNGPFNGYPLQLSICIPISNRMDTIEKCMRSLKPLLDNLDAEIIVVDTSTDGSVEIAKKYGAKIIPFQWTGDFSAARNTAIKVARGAWILTTDDDQWFEDCSEIIDFFKSDDYLKYDIATYQGRNYSDFSGKSYSDFTVTAMAKNHPQLHYVGIIHENFNLAFLTHRPKLKIFSCIMHHYGYAYVKPSDRAPKTYRNMKGLYFTLLEHPLDLKQHYQLANELTVLQQYKEASNYCFMILSLCRLLNNTQYAEVKLRHDVTITVLHIISQFISDEAFEKYICALTDLPLLNIYHQASIYFCKMICSHQAKIHPETVENSRKFREAREVFLSDPNQILLKASIHNDFVSPTDLLNRAYFLEAWALTALGKEDLADTVLEKVDFSILEGIYQRYLAELLYEMNLNSFQKHFFKVDTDIIAQLYKYVKLKFAEEPMAFIYLNSKIEKAASHSENGFIRLISLKAEPSNTKKYQWFIAHPTELIKKLPEVILTAAEHQYDLLQIVSVLDFEGIQLSLKTLNLLSEQEFTSYLSKYLIKENLDALNDMRDMKQLFFCSALLENLLFKKKKFFDGDEQSATYKGYFLSYIKMLLTWSHFYYSGNALSPENIGLLPSNIKAALALEKTLSYKSAGDMKRYANELKDVAIEFPLYEQGILALLQDIVEETNSSSQRSENEFNTLAVQLKNVALQLINSGDFEEAEKIASQLKALLPNDKEIDDLLSQCKSSSLVH